MQSQKAWGRPRAINLNIIDMKDLGIQDICMIKHGLAALIAKEKDVLKIAIKKDDKEQIKLSNSYIDEVKSVIRKLKSYELRRA